ncbi:MAG: hypothetical protein AAFX54_12370 [Pseudomonadota bacterium]
MSDPLNSAQQRRHEEIRAIKDRYADQYLDLPGVTGVGVGFMKTEKGEDTDELCLRVYTQKGAVSAVRELVGAQVENAPICVIEFEFSKDIHAQRARYLEEPPVEPGPPPPGVDVDTGKYNPLVGGVSIGPSRTINGGHLAGTLGLVVRDRRSGNPVMLSNYHVMCGDDGGAARGDDICQPSRVDNWFGYCSDCGQLERWHVGNVGGGPEYGVDVAIARITARTGREGYITEVDDNVSGAAVGHLNMPVFKRGRTTTETTGLIKDMSMDGWEDFGPPYGRIKMRNQLLIEPSVGNTFIEGGDSGSVLVNPRTMNVIGLCWASDNKNWGVASPITAVLNAIEADIY